MLFVSVLLTPNEKRYSSGGGETECTACSIKSNVVVMGNAVVVVFPLLSSTRSSLDGDDERVVAVGEEW